MDRIDPADVAPPNFAQASARRLPALAMAGALASGFLASACCLGPLLLAAIGLGGAGLLARLEPWRPLLTVFTFGLLGAAAWSSIGRARAAPAVDCGCAHPRANRLGRALLWVAALVAVGLWAFPYLAERFLA